MNKLSPFFVIEDLLSPLQCERLIAINRIENSPYSIRHLNEGQFNIVRNSVLDYKDSISERYDSVLSEDIKLLFQQFPENAAAPALPAQIDGWVSQRKRWSKNKNIDLIGYIPLKTYCDSLPIDLNFEVYGGKLEMLNFNFSILPERGSMIVFPCSPNFIHALSPINFGSYEVVKVHMTFENKWEYIADNFSSKIQDIL